MFRFVRDRDRGGDPSRRRYTVVRGEAERVGVVRLEDAATTRLAVECDPILTDAERDVLLAAVRSFVDELADGWGRRADEAADPDAGRWVGLPEGGFRCGLAFRIA